MRFKSVVCDNSALKSTEIEGRAPLKRNYLEAQNLRKFYINPNSKQVALDDACLERLRA